MEVWLFDHTSSTRTTHEVGDATFTLGRDPDNTLPLQSPFIARKHARVYRKGNQLFVEALSQAGTRVANREVKPRTSARVDFGDEIQIGPYAVVLVGDGESARRERDDSAALQTRLMELERKAHAELLERLNLRVTGSINKSDQRFVDQVLTELREVVDQRVADLDKRTIHYAVREHLRRLVIAEVVRQAQGKVATDYRVGDERLLNKRHERSVQELVGSIVDSMPLLFDPGSVADDVAVAEEAFDDALEQHRSALTADLSKYLVRRTVAKDLEDVLFGLGPLQDLLEMPSVSELMVVGKDRVYIEKNGVIQPTSRAFFSDEVLMSIIERILTPVGRRVDTSSPLVDARLEDGSRVNVVIPPLALAGPCLTIRKFGWVAFTMDDLIDRGSMSSGVAAMLQGCVLGRQNVIISGGTGSGKTTLLNVLSAFARPNERIVTIEESAELKLPQPHVVALEGRPANVEGRGAYTIRDLVRNALRMRPDRLIIGEVRGAEAIDMLQAMNTGHDGSLSTLHANTPEDAVKRLESLVLMGVDMPIPAIREQIVAAVDLIVQVARFADGRRRVTHVSEVTSIDHETGRIRLQDIFRLDSPQAERLRHTGYVPAFAEASVDKGYFDVSVFL